MAPTKAQVSKRLIDWHIENRSQSPFTGIVDIHRAVYNYGSFENVVDASGRFHPEAKKLTKSDAKSTEKATKIATIVKQHGMGNA